MGEMLGWSAGARKGVWILLLFGLSACHTMGLTAAVSMKVDRARGTPGDALVYIDEQFVGTLATVAARGVRLPEGEHRVSVEKNGYHPYDVLVVSDRKPIHLQVALLPLPEE